MQSCSLNRVWLDEWSSLEDDYDDTARGEMTQVVAGCITDALDFWRMLTNGRRDKLTEMFQKVLTDLKCVVSGHIQQNLWGRLWLRISYVAAAALMDVWHNTACSVSQYPYAGKHCSGNNYIFPRTNCVTLGFFSRKIILGTWSIVHLLSDWFNS